MAAVSYGAFPALTYPDSFLRMIRVLRFLEARSDRRKIVQKAKGFLSAAALPIVKRIFSSSFPSLLRIHKVSLSYLPQNNNYIVRP